MDDDDGDVKAVTFKLDITHVSAIKSNDNVVFAVILLAPSNLDADSMSPAWRPFRRLCWLLNQWPTMHVDGLARGLSIKPSFTTNANE